MNTAERDRKFDAMLTAALERRPEIAVPEGFAARVAAGLPARAAARPARETHYGRAAMYGCMLLLTVVMAWIPLTHTAAVLAMGSGASLVEMGCTAMAMLLFYFAEMWQAA